jgi:glutaredoxin-like YruB-family protein
MKVKVYSTPVCPYCVMAKKFLESLDVEYEDVDVSKDPEQAKDMIAKSGQRGVPVIEIGEKIIIGFNREEIKQTLGNR